MEDNEEKNSETGGSTRATSMNSEIGTAHLQSSHPRQQPKTHGCLSPTTTEPTPSSLDRPISPSVALSCDRVEQSISGGDGGAAAPHPRAEATSIITTIAKHTKKRDANRRAIIPVVVVTSTKKE